MADLFHGWVAEAETEAVLAGGGVGGPFGARVQRDAFGACGGGKMTIVFLTKIRHDSITRSWCNTQLLEKSTCSDLL